MRLAIGGMTVPIKYTKLLDMMEKRGITSYTIKRDGIIGQATFRKIKEGGHIDTRTIEKLCEYLNCQPGDIMEYVKEEDTDWLESCYYVGGGDYMSTAQSRASNKYAAKAYDRLYPFVPKGRKAEIQAVADVLGESLNDFIVTAIDERMERVLALREESKTGKKTDE